MIRDLRASEYRPASPPSKSLAFARDDIVREAGRSRATAMDGTGNPRLRPTPTRALTIAVTAPRTLTCKRGFAANLAAHLAVRVAGDALSVCVADTDIESRDVGTRFGIDGPTLLEVANNVTLRDARVPLGDTITRIDPPGLHVLPTRLPQSALVPLLHTKTIGLLGPLRAAFDFVVIDAPVSVGLGPYDWERTMLRHVDVLVVAVTAEASALGGVLRYLNAIAAAKNNGALPETFDAHVVLTGRDEDGSRSLLGEHDIDRKLRGIPVIASVPQLWGRQRPESPLDLDFHAGLHRDFSPIVERLTEDARNRRPD